MGDHREGDRRQIMGRSWADPRRRITERERLVASCMPPPPSREVASASISSRKITCMHIGRPYGRSWGDEEDHLHAHREAIREIMGRSYGSASISSRKITAEPISWQASKTAASRCSASPYHLETSDSNVSLPESSRARVIAADASTASAARGAARAYIINGLN